MLNEVTETRKQRHITLFEFQQKVFENKSRYRIISAGRRTGKSYLSCVEAIFHCLEQEDRKVLIVGPTYGQTKAAIWETLLSLIDDAWISRLFISTLEVEFINGSKISLKGSDRQDTLRGISPTPTMIICDEFAFFKPDTFKMVLQPMASDPIRKTRFLIISTPKGVGNEFHDFFLRGQDPAYLDWDSWQFAAMDVRPDMIEEVTKAMNTLDIRTFNQEYRADFTNTGNTVFYPFKFNVHVDDNLPWFERGETVHLAIDFNVAIQATSAFAVRGGQMHFLTEFQGAANTEELAKKLNAEFPNNKLVAYPDPSGKARKSSAATGVTDFSILEQAGIQVLAPSKAPPIIDSVNCVNRMLEDANGNSNMFFHSRCKNLILSMAGTQWKEATDGNLDNATIDKSANIEHFSDGVRYASSYLFPVRRSGVGVIKGRSF